jgi:hypothetical protein
MHLVLTQQDLARLSPELRAELQSLMFGSADTGADQHSLAAIEASDLPYQESERDFVPPWPEALEKTGNAKRVIDISENQARALLGNLSEKSIETLRLFSTGQSVSLDSLVGDGKAYESLSDLKRSFVGAVNRRLRTVTRNRAAVLFRRVDGEKDDSIAVRTQTALSLRQAFAAILEGS